MQVAITGGTGFIGALLYQKLLDRGYQITILTRNPQKAKALLPMASLVDITNQKLVQESLSRCEAIVNLAGRPIADPWNSKVKQEILDSRIQATRNLVDTIQNLSSRPKVMISGSAVGYYGTSLDATFTESSLSGNDFLAGVCRSWEGEADRVQSLGVRLVKIRTGIVLDQGGGVLGRILPIFMLGLGGPIGSGNQWFSWIHRSDLVSMIIFALEQEGLEGVLNGTAPQPVTNSEFTQALGQQIDRLAILPVPSLALKLAFGEGAVVLLEGQKVLPKRTIESGFSFEFPQLEDALGVIQPK